MTRSPLNVVAVSNDALRPELLDMLLAGSSYTVIVLESFAGAYSRISEVHAGLVVLFMEADDEDACRLLSMLQNDRALSGVRVLVCLTEPGRAAALSVPAYGDGSDRLAAASC
jgi:DNA-binding response OmpR family regulator